ncbi:MAG: AraC family transcriptional regulator ligand-binding domain-containing protein [Cellvibrionaceae bacterium]
MDLNSKIIPFRLHPTGFIEAFMHYGADLDGLLEGTDIHRGMFGRKDTMISYTQQQQLVANGLRLCRRPGLGLLVGNHFNWSYHGSVGSVVYCAPSLRDADAALRHYLLIPQPHRFYAQNFDFFVDADEFVIEPMHDFATPEDQREVLEFEVEFCIAQTVRIWDMCGNKSAPDPSLQLCLNFPEPAHADLYRQLPCSTVIFNSEDLTIGAHRLFVNEPWRQFRKHAFDRVIEQCEEELQAAEDEPSWAEKVRWHIYLHFFDTDLSLESVAHFMALSPRSLMRRLAAEGTSFRNILHHARMELTASHLRHSNLSIEEIADLLGFSCAATLRRAIKSWSGQSAGTFRDNVVDMKRHAQG